MRAMKISLAAVSSLVLVACRPGAPASPFAPVDRLSYEEHMAEADRLEAEVTFHREAAEAARRQGPTYECQTAPESEQTTSGGARLEGTRVCVDVAAADRRRHQRAADRLRADADRHRSQARSLVDAERVACAGLDISAMRDTPIGQRRTQVEVQAQEGAVRVILPAGVGVEAVRRPLACHRARAALYRGEAYMAHDPALVRAAQVEVRAASDGRAAVEIRGDAATLAQVRARAEALRGADGAPSGR